MAKTFIAEDAEQAVTPKQGSGVARKRKRKSVSTPESLERRRKIDRARYREREDIRIKARERTRRWRIENPERSRAAIKAWAQMKYRTDPEYRKNQSLSGRLRRQRIAGAYREKYANIRVYGTTQPRGPQAGGVFVRRIYRHAVENSARSGCKLEVDHIIPLTHNGVHANGNLQILPAGVNRQKGRSPFWMSDGLYLDWRDVPCSLWPAALRPEYERLIALHPKPVHAIRTGFKGQPPINTLAA